MNIMRKLKCQLDRKSLLIFFFRSLDLFWSMQMLSGKTTSSMKQMSWKKLKGGR